MFKMNLLEKCTTKEIQLFEKAGIQIENKDYDSSELKMVESEIINFIMSHSSKNGSIDKLRNEYNSIFRTIEMK